MLDLEEAKLYIKVDYDDDDSLIQLMAEAVLDEMQELIKGFDRESLTPRQKILAYAFLKELYDGRGKMEPGAGTTKRENLRFVIHSMLLKEMLEG